MAVAVVVVLLVAMAVGTTTVVVVVVAWISNGMRVLVARIDLRFHVKHHRFAPAIWVDVIVPLRDSVPRAMREI